MATKTTNTFSKTGDTVYIRIEKDGEVRIAQTTYREDYYEELQRYTWSINADGYPTNATLGGGLHRYIMSKWYGEDTLKEFTDKGFIVDHMNNNHCDCRITNLEFLKKIYNTAKGYVFDKDSKEIKHRIAVNLFKDFSTGHYQITIGCNDNICRKDQEGIFHYIYAIKLLYTCDYSIVINDAENIIRQYETEEIISVQSTHATSMRVYEAPSLDLTDEEKEMSVIERNGKQYLLLGTGKAFLDSVYFDEGWTPDTPNQ